MTFDGEACIRYLKDKTLSENERIAAAESLMHYPKPQTCEALFQVVLDQSEDHLIREEAAGSLGSLWAEMGYDSKQLFQIPDPYFREVVAEILFDESEFQASNDA